VTRHWGIRDVPAALVHHYRAAGWWTDHTLGQLVHAGVAERGASSVNVHSDTRPWRGTFAEVHERARCFAAALAHRGIGPGDVVVMQLPNWVEAAITFWGTAHLGAVIVPVVHFYGAKELGYVLDAVEPDLIVTAASFAGQDRTSPLLHLVTPDRADRWFVVASDGTALPSGLRPFEELLDDPPMAEPVATDPSAPAVIGFTSGTTRNPKGVVHSHQTLGFEVRQLSSFNPVLGPPPIIGAPVGHFIGMLGALLLPFFRDQPINVIDQWDPAEVLRIMGEERLSLGGGATYFVTSLLDHPDFTDDHLALIPSAGIGGSAVPVAVTQRLTDLGITVYRAYGSTEHPSTPATFLDGPEAKRLATDGRALEGVEIRLDEQGQVLSRGPDLCIGYTDPALTAAAFDDDGWYRTGDIAVQDADGYITITDRAADVIIRGGENISPAEVEEQVMAMPGVAEVAVVAVPDQRLGEKAVAVIRRAAGAPPITLEMVREHLATVGLAKQKWPEALHLVDELPRTPSGKIQKYVLRRRFGDAEPTAASRSAP
jgi:acyl-CoA synthetase (AMP-forming)/AMP-acid ligase II